MGKEPLFYEPADKILFLVPKKQVFGWWSDVYLVVDQSKFVELIRQIISEQSDEVDISKKTRLGSLVGYSALLKWLNSQRKLPKTQTNKHVKNVKT